MGKSRDIIKRLVLRVGVSTLSEISGRAVNILLPFVVISVHGVNKLTDNFFIAMAVGFYVQGTIANVCVTALVPEFIKNSEKRCLVQFFYSSFLAASLAALVSAILATNSLSSVAHFISTISIGLIALSGITSAPAIAALNAAHRYGMPGLTWGLRLIPVFAYMLWQPKTSALHWLLAGIALTDILRMTFLLWLARMRLSLQKKYESLHFNKAANYLIIASAIAGLTPLLARWIASFGDDGTVSLYEAADRIYVAVASLATLGVGNVTLVYLAHLNSTDMASKGWRLILRAHIAWSLLWLIIGVSLWGGFPVVSKWFHIPMETAVTTVRNTFLAFVFGLPGFIMTGMFSRRLTTIGLTHTNLFITCVGFLFNLGGSVLLFYLYGITGIAIILSCSQYLVAFLMFHKLARS